MAATAEVTSGSDPSITPLKSVQYLQFKHHARQRIRERAGLDFDLIEDMVLQPHGLVYFDIHRESYVVYDPAAVAVGDKEKTRAVIVAVEGQTATIITAYIVDDPLLYERNDQYRFLADMR
jgi:hypothetical protein